MIKREYQEVVKRELVTVSYICDCCGKTHESSDLPDDWHMFSGHHNSWGNDSCDSYEYYLACSPKCYCKLLSKAVQDFEGYTDAIIDEFRIEFAKRLSVYLNIKTHP
jgi:hypothetical protein